MTRDLIKNRKAYHDYEILETMEAGLVLVGTEVKSLREGNANLQDAYVAFKKDELYLLQAFIGHYKHGNIHNHEEKRDRKLLLHKKELIKLRKAVQEKGIAIVPLSVYLKKNRVKVSIATARGKKLHDKRSSLKEKEHKRMIEKAMKEKS